MKRNLLSVIALFFLCLAVKPAGAQSVLKEKPLPTIMKFLVDASPEYSIMVKTINSTRLDETFKGPGPITMFAPVNKAFDVLPAGTVENWLKPEMNDSLKGILTYHVIQGNWPLTDLEQKIKEAGGEFFVPTIGPLGQLSFMMENGRVVVKDKQGFKTPLGMPVKEQNGMVYRIDKILLP